MFILYLIIIPCGVFVEKWMMRDTENINTKHEIFIAEER